MPISKNSNKGWTTFETNEYFAKYFACRVSGMGKYDSRKAAQDKVFEGQNEKKYSDTVIRAITTFPLNFQQKFQQEEQKYLKTGGKHLTRNQIIESFKPISVIVEPTVPTISPPASLVESKTEQILAENSTFYFTKAFSLLASEITNELIDTMKKLNEELRAKLQESMSKALDDHLDLITAPSKPEVKIVDVSPVFSKRKKIVIVGLINSQFQIVKHKFKHLDLRHVPTAGSTNTDSKNLYKNADKVVAMIKFINHSTVTNIQSANNEMVYCNGGMTDLEQVLNNI